MKNQKKQKIEEVPQQNFSFKITNLRKVHFPKELTETDIMRIKVGDYVTKYKAYDVWEVIAIERYDMTQDQYDSYTTKLVLTTPITPENIRVQSLLTTYNKSLNFGLCYVKVKPVIKDGEAVSDRRTSYFSEAANHPLLGGINSYTKVDLKVLSNFRDQVQADLRMKIQKLEDEMLAGAEFKVALDRILYPNPNSVSDCKVTNIEVGSIVYPIPITHLDGVIEFLDVDKLK